MARGRGRQKHLVGSIKPHTPDDEGKARWKVTPLCNEKYIYHYVYRENWTPLYGNDFTFTAFPDAHDVCSKCQSKFLAKELKAKPGDYYLGERLDLSVDNPPHGISRWTWKSVYPVIERSILADKDDPTRIVAFICIEAGWGKTWQIRGWDCCTSMRQLGEGKISEPRMSGETANYTSRYEISGEKRESVYVAQRIPSKEAALLKIAEMITDGHLKTYNACVEADTQSLETYRRTEAERAQRRSEEEQNRILRQSQREADDAIIKDGLRSILSKASNMEREALFLAWKRLYGELVFEIEHVVVDDDDWSFT